MWIKQMANGMGIPFDREINNRFRGVSRMASLEIILEKYTGPALSEERKAELAQQKNPAQYWRIRSGTADQHTSFSIGYNIGLSAQAQGMNVDYHLVWNMGHGSNEGTSTGTFIDWINAICSE